MFVQILQVREDIYHTLQCSELKLHILKVREFQLLFCLQIGYTLARYTMNEQFY